MTHKSITLYSYAMSPYAWKVHACLLYKRLPFQCFYVNPLRRRAQLPVGIQVPVLSIGDESRADSTPIALWLDDEFPERAVVPKNAGARDRVLAIDRWVSHRLIPSTFRTIPGVGLNMDRVRNGWRLGSIMNQTAHGGLPWIVHASWPLILSRLGFLRRAISMTDTHLSVDEANDVLYRELLDHLGDGPFLGGQQQPTLADFGAAPQLIMPLRAGMIGAGGFERYGRLVEWTRHVEAELAPCPPILPDIVMSAPAGRARSTR